jgi:hypothetical protein
MTTVRDICQLSFPLLSKHGDRRVCYMEVSGQITIQKEKKLYTEIKFKSRHFSCFCHRTIFFFFCLPSEVRSTGLYYSKKGRLVTQEQSIRNHVFWDITTYSLVEVHRRFKGTSCFLLQGQERSRRQARILTPYSLFGLLFDPEIGSSMFLRKSVDSYQTTLRCITLHYSS